MRASLRGLGQETGHDPGEPGWPVGQEPVAGLVGEEVLQGAGGVPAGQAGLPPGALAESPCRPGRGGGRSADHQRGPFHALAAAACAAKSLARPEDRPAGRPGGRFGRRAGRGLAASSCHTICARRSPSASRRPCRHGTARRGGDGGCSHRAPLGPDHGTAVLRMSWSRWRTGRFPAATAASCRSPRRKPAPPGGHTGGIDRPRASLGSCRGCLAAGSPG
jgi:hypothetical protein